jgi:hypothetical protein
MSVNCRNCGDPITRRRGGGKDKMLFCNQSCAATWNNLHRPRYAADQPPCRTCPRCGGRKADTAQICRNCWQADLLTGREGLTIGELREAYGTHAFHAKLRGLARSAYRGPKSCRQCGYDLHVDVCHLQPVSSFPPTATVAEVNAQDNLAAFCPNHHWELDAGLLIPV